jgi:CRP-like cAMP-binding protein
LYLQHKETVLKSFTYALLSCPLFSGAKETDLPAMLSCLDTRIASFAAKASVLSPGDPTDQFGILLSGQLHVVQDDYWGNRSLLTQIEPGELFAEAFAFSPLPALPVGVVAAEACEVLLVPAARVFQNAGLPCAFHSLLVQNMIGILAQKNVFLTQKIEHLTRRTTREKLLSYLSAQARLSGASSFQIPFDRQQLADYLAVDRSAMSAELSRMQKDGLLTYSRNSFTLH